MSSLIGPWQLSLVFLALAVGCDNSDRIARLQKQNQDLQAEITKSRAAADYDLQAKCSKDARAWFNENWARGQDKKTILLDFTNHYNKKLNKCFILVEYHYNSNLAGPGSSSWTNNIELSDVYENAKYGTFAENHYTHWKPEITTSNEVIICEGPPQKCKTIEEFNGFVRPYMSD